MYGTDTHRVFKQWWQEHARVHYVPLPARGHPEWVAMYYDPIIDYVHRGGPPVGVALAFYLSAQEREVARRLFGWAASAYGWDDPAREIPRPRDPVTTALGLVMATELGARGVLDRLRPWVEQHCEPTWGPEAGEFTWGFGLGEPIPRGQPNAMIMVGEVGAEGSWWRLFNEPNVTKFDQPTVCGVDYPTLGIRQAWVDRARRQLVVATYAADPRRRGAPTEVRVTNLPDLDSVRVVRDGAPYLALRASGAGEITIATDIDDHAFLIDWTR
jgi:hypothetical protein